jgi:hypothetical protein
MMEFHIWNHILYGLSPSPHGKNNNKKTTSQRFRTALPMVPEM